MKRLPNNIARMIEQYCETGRMIDKALRELTNDSVAICSPDHVQFWIDDDNINGNGPYTLEDFKQLVGPENVKLRCSHVSGYMHHDVHVGTEVCKLVTSGPGGASDDVSINA